MIFTNIFTLNQMFNPKLNHLTKNCTVMDAQMNHAPTQEEIQVYRNDFYSGILMLAKKLFML